MDYVGGLLGFLGYEGLKVYKCSWDGKPLPPKENFPPYLISIIVLGIFSSFVAHVLAAGNMGLALFIGFSIPTDAKAILEPRSRKYKSKGVTVDDISVGAEVKPTGRGFRAIFDHWFRSYFGFSNSGA